MLNAYNLGLLLRRLLLSLPVLAISGAGLVWGFVVLCLGSGG
jgi:hypothetical protein